MGTSSLLLRSATRSDSCLPPPLVRRMKGICCDWRKESALCARGRASELRTSTPSILTAVSGGVDCRVHAWSYSKAKAKSGERVKDDTVCKARRGCIKRLLHRDSLVKCLKLAWVAIWQCNAAQVSSVPFREGNRCLVISIYIHPCNPCKSNLSMHHTWMFIFVLRRRISKNQCRVHIALFYLQICIPRKYMLK